MSVTAPTPNVPADWGVVRTSEVCEVQNGCAFKSEFFNEKSEGLPLIRIRDVHSGRSDTFYSGPFDQKYVVSDGDLLIGMDGEFRVRKWRSGKGLLNQRVCRLIPYGEPMIADFLYYSIGRPLKQIEDFTPFTTVKHISAGQIRAIELPLPPLPEQKKIAHILSTVQRAIEAQERIIQTTTELKKALMQKLFTEGLRGEPQKQTEIGPIPESWEVVPLGCESPQLLTVMRNGYTGKQTTDPQQFSVTRIETIGGGFIDRSRVRYAIAPTADVIEKYLVRRGDILFSHINSDPHLGKTGIAAQDSDDLLHGMNLLLIRTNSKVLDPWFLNSLFQWYREKGVFIAICSRAVNQSSINQGKMNALAIPLPSLVEQKEIAAAFLSIDQKTADHERRRYALQDLFRTLLHELMTAKTRVHELEFTS